MYPSATPQPLARAADIPHRSLYAQDLILMASELAAETTALPAGAAERAGCEQEGLEGAACGNSGAQRPDLHWATVLWGRRLWGCGLGL